MNKQNSGVIAAGLALFSMFFGAGDLIWPLILGGQAGDKNLFAMLGLLITGVSLPLLGLIAMMLFEGDYRSFFGRIGRGPSLVLIFFIMAILGPFGTIPRAITLSYATLKPYIPFEMSLIAFSIASSVLILAFTLRPQKVIDLLGLVLTPILLLSLGAILAMGLWDPPQPSSIELVPSAAFSNGLQVGYNTLDLIASFIFAPLVMSHFITDRSVPHTIETRREMFKKMVKASCIAAGLLTLMYIGLTYVSSFYTPYLNPEHLPEERLSAIAMLLLGPKGAFISCIAVAMACLTTAIPVVSIFADYIREDLLPQKRSNLFPLLATLGLSIGITNLGFMGIAQMLSPMLQILCPGLIMLSLLNIFHKLYETRVPKVPVFATFALSTLSHVM